MTNSGEQLLSYIERIERVESEIADLNGDKAEIFAEAKANGFDKATIRKIVALRRKDPAERAEQDALLETYLKAIADAESSRVHVHAREGACGVVVAIGA